MGTIPVYTTFHLNQTIYTLSHPEASFSHSEPSLCLSDPLSVILNEVKDLHTQFRVSCPVEKESKNARSRHKIIHWGVIGVRATQNNTFHVAPNY